MPKGIIGRKVGMTQIFNAAGDCIPVTVVQAGPCTVVRKKTAEGKDGYNAIVLGFEDARFAMVDGEKEYKLNKPELGVFKASNVEPKKILREIRLWDTDIDKYEAGQEIKADLFVAGETIDVIGTSKGHGFTGVMKRHNFRGTNRTHGVHEYFRHGGSIGTTSTPGRTCRGRRMAGQDGNSQVTIENLKVYAVDAEKNLILVKGSIPGANGSLVIVQDAAKLRRRPRVVKK